MAAGLESALAAVENLTLTLDEIDDKEFDLPTVENPPTLESILNEPDNENDSIFGDEQLPTDQMFQGDQGDTSSMSSQEGILSDRPRKRPKKSIRYAEHGSILRHVILKQLSAQLMSAADRVDAGLPTALAVAGLVAVGTSHGLVLIFDPKQVLKWCLGSTAVGAQYGAVSALSFNRDCSRLLCGFAKGQITMWDLTNGKLLRTITDAHPPGTAILHVKFTDELTLAVCSDSGGSVFELEFKRLIGVRTCESRCLFSGSRGEVCTVEPLHMNYTIKDHPMKSVILLAMASLSKVLIVTMKPQLKVLFTFPLKGDSGTLPLLAWQFVIIQVSEQDRVIDPVLAFARDQTIHFFQVVCTDPDDIKFAPLQKTELPYKLLALSWMNSRTLVVIDTSERIHILDVRSEEELEVIDIGEVQLTYSSSFYKSLATGGNVSKALAYAGERACYQSVVSYGGQLLLLGTKSIHVMTMRSWEERIDVLAKQEKYQQSLNLAQTFYEGRAKAVVGLLGGIQKRRAVVTEKMLELLDAFVDASMTRHCPERGKLEQLEEYYQTVVPVCVDYCLTLNRIDILFGKLYERFSSDPIAKGTFLECLEPYILSDKLTSITPSVMKDFVSHYEAQGLLESVEACIVHLDIASLDIHQVVVLCWTHGLYDAILYIYNKGMMDYTTPLEELLRLLRSAVMTGKQLSDDHIRLGNKLLVYISCCLAGRAYPLGDIPSSVVEKVKDDVFMCVTCLHTKEADDEEPVYPHLKTLLQFDTREFFNVLALAFEEPEFSTPEGIEKRQRVVDILLQIMVESIGFSPTQVGILFTFLARQMARHENTIMVNRLLFEQVLEFLAQPGDDSHHEERQQALMELLAVGHLLQYDEERLLSLAENAKFYRVCEMLYQRRREFDKILSCYWRDPFRRHQAFAYIQSIMTGEEYSFEEKVKVQREALSHLQELISIDSKKTAQLVLDNFLNSLHEVITILNPTPPVCFEFLQGVFEYRDSNGSAIHTERQMNVEPQIQEHYIDLMCQFQPASVYAYVKMAEGYRLEETLEICRKYRVLDATAFLLEKTGDVEGAFNIYLQNLQEKIKNVVQLLSSTVNETGPEKVQQIEQNLTVAWSSVQTVLLVLIQLNQRNSAKMEESSREALWFPLLEAMMMPQRKLKDSVDKKYLEAFKELTRHVLNSMMGYISLPAILQKIMQDPSYNTGKFGEIKELLLGMLDTYNYEKTLLHTCNRLLNQDLHHQLLNLTWAASRGYTTRTDSCHLCSKHFVNVLDTDSVILFRCGHGYHISCLRAIGAGQMIDGEMHWACHLCSSAKRGRLQSTRIQRLPSQPGPEQDVNAKNKGAKPVLDEMQVQSIDNLRRAQKTKSRLGILTELAKHNSSSRSSAPSRTGSILQNDRFKLHLASPPPFDL